MTATVTLRVHIARGFCARARGLIGRPQPMPGCALLMQGVTLVHGFGMRHAIDLVFVDDEGLVVDCAILAPARVAGCRGARHVLEMRAGEIERLGLRPGSCLRLVSAATIFSASLRVVILAAVLFAGLMRQGITHAASPYGSIDTPGPFPVPPQLMQPLAPRTLQRLENEAEARYHARSAGDDAELIRLYQSLAGLAADRAPQAWLRIGNIHQRAGSVGGAIDAYRRMLDAPLPAGARAAEAAVAQRKALLNLAALALEQARRALSQLQTLGGATAAAMPHGRELRTLEERLVQQHASAKSEDASVQEPASAGTGAGSPGSRGDSTLFALPPQTVERYTASARRNAVQTARGSLHLDPADGLPAGQVAKARPRRTYEALPRVEYLLGDPDRSQAARDGDAAAIAGAGTRREGPAGKRREPGR